MKPQHHNDADDTYGTCTAYGHRDTIAEPDVVATSLVLNSLPWWLRYATLGLVACGLYMIWTVPTLPDDAPRAPRTIAE